MFSDLKFRKRWIFGEIGICTILIVIQICVFIYSVTSPNIDVAKNSFISVDGILLGLCEVRPFLAFHSLQILKTFVLTFFLKLVVAGGVAALMIFMAIFLKCKQYYNVKSGMQLHVTVLIWLGSFLLQGILSLLAENLEQYDFLIC